MSLGRPERIPEEQRRALVEERRQQPRPAPAVAPLAKGSYAAADTRAVPKTRREKESALLDMAEGRPCLLLVPSICNHRLDTTVACHQNEGKGMARKQSDPMSVWGCAACHEWYDRSGAPREQKRATFMAAHARQVLAWRVVATDPAEPSRFRKAALRALEYLNASPLPEVPDVR